MFEWIRQITESLSYWSLALLMFLENVFPPIPSEIVMPAAGFAARSGEMSFWGVLIAGTVGSLIGTTLWYFAGRLLGEDRLYQWIERHGKWITVRRSEAENAVAWFRDWGAGAVFFGRMVPGVRTLISVPAGFVKMSFWRFVAYTTLGTAAWNVLLAWLGWLWRDNYEQVGDVVGWISMAVVAGMLLWWLIRLVRRNVSLNPS